MGRRREGLEVICSVIGISMAVVIIILAIGFVFVPRIDKKVLETLFICGAVENFAFAVRYGSRGQKKSWLFLIGGLLLTCSTFLLGI